MAKRTASFKTQRSQIVQELVNDLKLNFDEKGTITEIKKVIVSFYNETLENWGAGGPENDKSKYGVEKETPVIKFIPENGKFTYTKKGVQIQITSLAVNAKGQPHHIWYWVNDGTRTITWNFGYSSAAFRPRTSHRTKSGTTKVGSSVGYAGNTVVIKDGDQRRGIDARGWADKIGEKSQNVLSKQNIAGYDWDVDFVYRKPKLKKI